MAKPKYNPITPEAAEMARQDAAAGISTTRIQARILIKLGQNARIDEITKAVADILKERRKAESAAARANYFLPRCLRRADLHVVRPASIPAGPGLVNLWAVMTVRNGIKSFSTMKILRSRFISRGERAYRVIPMGQGEPYTIWAENDTEWARKLLRFGLRVVWDMFEVEYSDYIKLDAKDDSEEEAAIIEREAA